jgi:dienelactone hydrolase
MCADLTGNSLLARSMVASVRITFIAALVVGASSARAQARITIPVSTRVAGTARVLQLEGFLYRPRGTGPFPVVVLNHGSAGGSPKASLPAARLAGYFVRHNMIVVVPMRRGRGRSEGVSLESEERNCDPTSWWPGLDAAFADLSAAIDFARHLSGVDSTRLLLAGVSRGGFLSVAYAARGARRSSITGVVNWVGAWVAQRDDRCPRDFNAISFAEFGREAAAPMLWLYADNDPFNDATSIEQYARAFHAAGGKAQCVLLHTTAEVGHALADYPELWRDTTDAYLASIGLARR